MSSPTAPAHPLPLNSSHVILVYPAGLYLCSLGRVPSVCPAHGGNCKTMYGDRAYGEGSRSMFEFGIVQSASVKLAMREADGLLLVIWGPVVVPKFSSPAGARHDVTPNSPSFPPSLLPMVQYCRWVLGRWASLQCLNSRTRLMALEDKSRQKRGM
jgi:hypothetical protein